MSILIEKTDEKIIIRLPHNFAIKEVDEFRRQVYNLIEQGEKNFQIDFAQCAFIDSTGVGVLISIYKKCTGLGGSIKLYSIPPQIMRIFTLTSLDKLFEIYP